MLQPNRCFAPAGLQAPAVIADHREVRFVIEDAVLISELSLQDESNVQRWSTIVQQDSEDVLVRSYTHECNDIQAIARERETTFPRLDRTCDGVRISSATLSRALASSNPQVCAKIANVVTSTCSPAPIYCTVSQLASQDTEIDVQLLRVDERGVLYVNCEKLSCHRGTCRFVLTAEDLSDVSVGRDGVPFVKRSNELAFEVIIGGHEKNLKPAHTNANKKIQQARDLDSSPHSLDEGLERLPVMPIHSFRPSSDTVSGLVVAYNLILTQPFLMFRSTSDICERRMLRRDFVVTKENQHSAHNEISSLLKDLDCAISQPLNDDVFFKLNNIIPLLFALGEDECLVKCNSFARLRVQLKCRSIGISEASLVEPALNLPIQSLAGVLDYQQANTKSFPTESSQIRLLASVFYRVPVASCEQLLQCVVEAGHIAKHVGYLTESLKWYRVALTVSNLLVQRSDSHAQVASENATVLPLLRVIGDVLTSVGSYGEAIECYEIAHAIAEAKSKLVRNDDNPALHRQYELQALTFDCSIAVTGCLSSKHFVSSSHFAFQRCVKSVDGLRPAVTACLASDDTASAIALADSCCDVLAHLAFCCFARDSFQQGTKLVSDALEMLQAVSNLTRTVEQVEVQLLSFTTLKVLSAWSEIRQLLKSVLTSTSQDHPAVSILLEARMHLNDLVQLVGEGSLHDVAPQHICVEWLLAECGAQETEVHSAAAMYLLQSHPMRTSIKISQRLHQATLRREASLFLARSASTQQSQEAAADHVVVQQLLSTSSLTACHLLQLTFLEVEALSLVLDRQWDYACRCLGEVAHTALALLEDPNKASPSHLLRRDALQYCRRLPSLSAQCFSYIQHRNPFDTSRAEVIATAERFVLELINELGVDRTPTSASPATSHLAAVAADRKDLPFLFLDVAELRFAQRNFVGCLEVCGRALRLADERNLLYLLGDLFRPSFLLSATDVEDRSRLLRERRASPAGVLTLALALFTTGRVHEVAGNVVQSLSTFGQCFAALEMMKLLEQPVATEALIGCARSCLQLGNIGDALMYTDMAESVFLDFHSQFGAFRANEQLVELHGHLHHLRLCVSAMTKARGYELVQHEVVYTAPSLNGFPLYI